EWRYLASQCRSDEAATLARFGSCVFTVSISRDGHWLAAACGNGTVGLWDLRTRRQLPSFETFRGPESFLEFEDRSNAAAFSPDSKALVTGGQLKPVKLWDLTNPQAPRQIGSLDSMWIEDAAFSPDGTRLAICDSNQRVRLFEFPSLRELEPLRGQPGCHVWLAFSPDGRRLASAGGNLCICIWDLEHPEKLQMFKGHDKDPQCLAFTPDGNTLVSAASDGTVRLWDTATSS